jgi:hypothetical protein
MDSPLVAATSPQAGTRAFLQDTHRQRRIMMSNGASVKEVAERQG